MLRIDHTNNSGIPKILTHLNLSLFVEVIWRAFSFSEWNMINISINQYAIIIMYYVCQAIQCSLDVFKLRRQWADAIERGLSQECSFISLSWQLTDYLFFFMKLVGNINKNCGKVQNFHCFSNKSNDTFWCYLIIDI